MKRIIGMACAVLLALGLSVSVAQPAAAGCEEDQEGQVARVEAESEAAGEVDPFSSKTHVYAEVWTSEDGEYPVSASVLLDTSGVVCSDLVIEEVKDTVEP